ncbi:MAG: hypothetical protein LBC97_14885 [Bifidobacteriaceae bacterium]|jgi:hypothetical protein|nr:hypothetical protein [Bifidobacteriaceae bacterium]
MSSEFVSTTTGVVKSLGRLLGATFKASGKAMDDLSDRLRAYADNTPPPPPIIPNDDQPE